MKRNDSDYGESALVKCLESFYLLQAMQKNSLRILSEFSTLSKPSCPPSGKELITREGECNGP